jgi:hypothetical protein
MASKEEQHTQFILLQHYGKCQLRGKNMRNDATKENTTNISPTVRLMLMKNTDDGKTGLPGNLELGEPRLQLTFLKTNDIQNSGWKF